MCLSLPYIDPVKAVKTIGMDGRPTWLSKTGKDAVDPSVLKSTVWPCYNVERQSVILNNRVQLFTSNLKNTFLAFIQK